MLYFWCLVVCITQLFWLGSSQHHFPLRNNTIYYRGKVLAPGEKIVLPKRLYENHLLIDAFPYNGERMAELRLNYLEGAVDLFVVSDAWYIHTGWRKNSLPTVDHRHLFEKLDEEGRLITVVINEFPCDIGTEIVPYKIDEWLRERYQRNVFREILLDHIPENDTYVLMSMDGDEIPRREIVEKLTSNYNELTEGLRMKMMFFYYSFKWIKSGDWVKACVVNDKFLRNNGESILNEFRVRDLRQTRSAEDQGWHCSYFSNASVILEKVRAIADHKYLPVVPLDWAQRCITEGLDLYNRTTENERLHPYDGRRGLPTCRKCDVFLIY